MLSFSSVTVLHFTFRYIFHAELNFLKGIRFAFRVYFFTYRLLCSIVLPVLLCQRQFDNTYVLCYVYLWALYSVLLIQLSVLLPITHCLDYCSFGGSLKLRQCQPPDFVFSSNIVLAILGLFSLYLSFNVSLLICTN